MKAGGNPVQDFQLQEYICETPIHAAIVLCLAGNSDEAITAELDAAMKRCCALQRPDDIVTVSKLSHEAQLNSRADNAESAAGRLRTALSDIDFSLPNLHLIVVGASPTTVVIEALLKLAASAASTVHVVACAQNGKPSN